MRSPYGTVSLKVCPYCGMSACVTTPKGLFCTICRHVFDGDEEVKKYD